ncbi:hypothetical protein EWM64_g1325 [Hericium alpestre]|uniref:SAP domain-containing protein n=1 Tax=Hericium alpestre TaxID=135208 RepID=A0A4Z0A7G8_9AGAM|nr:hypothetical protein EWM64_g1325 [Hericium alpestre]
MHRKPTVDDVNLEPKLEQALRDLEYLQATLLKTIARISPPKDRLVFVQDPAAGKPYARRSEEGLREVNAGPNKLAPRNPMNAYIIAIENELAVLLHTVEGIRCYDDALATIRRDFIIRVAMRELDRLDQIKEAEWNWQMVNSAVSKTMRHSQHGLGVFVDCSPYYRNMHHTWHPAILSVFLTVMLMNLVCGLSRRASGLLITGMRCITRILTIGRDDPELSRISQSIPKDPRTIIGAFDLEPRTKSYICCPTCFALYDDSLPPPPCCTYKQTPASRTCKASLLRTRLINGKKITCPIRKYVHQEMKEWVARLFSRPDMEELLDKPLYPDPLARGDQAEDIWDARTFAAFLGPDGKSFLRPDNAGESRLVFSLNVDGFNPFGTKAAKQSVSVTGIYMVCLNLPPHLRYLPENMYLVGVVPGPSKPSHGELNHFLALLVDDLLPFWTPGVFLSRTANRDKGRLVKAVLIPLVSDMLGAKQAAGFSGHSSKTFCSYCLLPLDRIEEFDRERWPTRDPEEHIRLATAWKNAKTPDDQQHIYETYGLRWSELLRLPYWNPLLFTVIDSMHNLYLGVLKYHCRTLWGMDIAADDEDPGNHPPRATPARPNPLAMKKAKQLLLDQKFTALKASNKPLVWHLCLDLGLRRASTKAILLKHLQSWREKAPEADLKALREQLSNSSSDGQLGDAGSEDDFSPSGPLLAQTAAPEVASMSDPKTPSGAHHDPSPPTFPVDENSTSDGQGAQQLMPANKDVKHAEARLRSEIPIHMQAMVFYDRSILVSLCKELKLVSKGNKTDLALRLLSWRSSNNLPVAPPLPTIRTSRGLASEEKQRKLVQDIAAVDAWFSSAPHPVQEGDLQCWTMVILSALCENRKISVSGKKPIIVARLLQWKNRGDAGDSESSRSSQINEDEHADDAAGVGKHDLPEPESRSASPDRKPANRKPKKAVLGRTILSEMRADMAKTELPAWVSPAPSSIGSTRHGKPSADQWRSLCTIHLPITLVRLWGGDNGLFKEMLSNFIDLIVAVEVGTMRVVTEKHSALYDKLMARYLNKMKELYKDARVVPNHHVALHLGDFLRSFGSVHAWRAFAFERYNYLLQQENTNQKFGELETTFIKQSCRSANFRPLMQDPIVRETVIELVEGYKAFSTEDRRGTRVQDTLDTTQSFSLPTTAKEGDLEDETYEAFFKAAEVIRPGSTFVETARKMEGQRFLSRRCLFSPTVFIKGVTYKTYKKSPKDSNVIFRLQDGVEKAGRMEVRTLSDLSKDDAACDNYRRFPFGTGRLYYDYYSAEFVVRATDIVCHFAKTAMVMPTISRPCVHVLPLDTMVTSALLPDFDDVEEDMKDVAADLPADDVY